MSDNIITLDDHRERPEEPSTMVMQITVYDNGDGTLWLADMIETKEQFNWATAKVAEVVSTLLQEKADRTGEM